MTGPQPDVRIITGKTFTTARVAGRVVAVIWGHDKEFFVSGGTGSALHCGSREEAVHNLMRLAMADSGVATVTIRTEGSSGPLRAAKIGHCDQPMLEVYAVRRVDDQHEKTTTAEIIDAEHECVVCGAKLTSVLENLALGQAGSPS